MIQVVYVVMYLRMLFIFLLSVHFMKTIDLFCLIVLITLFPSLQNTYSLDVAKLVRGIEYFIAQISAYIYSTNDYKHGGVNGRTPLRPG